jgi:hypothetical protein
MAYLLQPVNKPYDPEEPMPTPLGFVANIWAGGGNDFKRQFKPVPQDRVPKKIEIGSNRLDVQPAIASAEGVLKEIDFSGERPMPDFFQLAADHYYVSSRFRSVLERYASGAVEYIEVQFNIPASKKPAGAYYFINVLGRGQLIDWEFSDKRGPARGWGEGRENKSFYSLVWQPDRWAMKAPPPGHPAIWHEAGSEAGDLIYIGSGTDVFVTSELGDALNAAFPGQARLYPIRES